MTPGIDALGDDETLGAPEREVWAFAVDEVETLGVGVNATGAPAVELLESAADTIGPERELRVSATGEEETLGPERELRAAVDPVGRAAPGADEVDPREETSCEEVDAATPAEDSSTGLLRATGASSKKRVASARR